MYYSDKTTFLEIKVCPIPQIHALGSQYYHRLISCAKAKDRSIFYLSGSTTWALYPVQSKSTATGAVILLDYEGLFSTFLSFLRTRASGTGDIIGSIVEGRNIG